MRITATQRAANIAPIIRLTAARKAKSRPAVSGSLRLLPETVLTFGPNIPTRPTSRNQRGVLGRTPPDLITPENHQEDLDSPSWNHDGVRNHWSRLLHLAMGRPVAAGMIWSHFSPGLSIRTGPEPSAAMFSCSLDHSTQQTTSCLRPDASHTSCFHSQTRSEETEEHYLQKKVIRAEKKK